MFTISKEFHFSASHQLLDLPPEHPCARLHGHNYIVVLKLKAAHLTEHGFVQDYHSLNFFKDYIDLEIDHRHLNDLFAHNAITAEFLAQHFYCWCKPKLIQLYKVMVSETPKTWASYSED